MSEKPVRIHRAIRRNAWKLYKQIEWKHWTLPSKEPTKYSRATLRVEREREKAKFNLVAAGLSPLMEALYRRHLNA